MFVISLQNGSLPPLCKSKRIASLYPVWLISFQEQTNDAKLNVIFRDMRVPWAPGASILTVDMTSLLSQNQQQHDKCEYIGALEQKLANNRKTEAAPGYWYDQNVIFLSNCNIRAKFYTHVSGIRVLDHLYFCWDMCESTIQYCFPGSFYCILSVLEIRGLCNTQCVQHLAANQPLRYLLKYKKTQEQCHVSASDFYHTPGTTIQPFILFYTFLSTAFHKSNILTQKYRKSNSTSNYIYTCENIIAIVKLHATCYSCINLKWNDVWDHAYMHETR